MADNSTRTTFFGPVVSFRTEKGHAASAVHVLVPSTGTLEVDGFTKIDGTLQLGASGVSFAGIRRSTVSVALGTVAFDSVTTSVTIPNIAIGDPVLAIVPASIWSGAYDDIVLRARASADSTVQIVAVNSTLTGINTAAMNMDVVWLDMA